MERFRRNKSLELTYKNIQELNSELLTYIHERINQRQEAKQNKDYALADKMEYECPFNNDLETGDAVCYMFEASDTPSHSDEWYEKNKAENEKQLRNVKD